MMSLRFTLPILLTSFTLMTLSCAKNNTTNDGNTAKDTSVKNQSIVGSKWAGVIMIEGGNTFSTKDKQGQDALYRSPLFRVSICIPKNFSSLQSVKIPFSDLGFPNLINIPAKNDTWLGMNLTNLPWHNISNGIFINTDISSEFAESDKYAVGRFKYQSSSTEDRNVAPSVMTGLVLGSDLQNYERTMQYLAEDQETNHYVSIVKRTYVENDQSTTTLPGCEEASSLLRNIVIKKFDGEFRSHAICSVAETKIFNDKTILANVTNACSKYTLKK